MSNWLLRFVFVLFTILAGSAAIAKDLPKEEQMIVRIAEIQVDRSQLEEYLKQARTVGAESVSKEPGVIAIFPMVEKRNRNKSELWKFIRMRRHIRLICKRPIFKIQNLYIIHGQKLDLVDMTPLDEQAMPLIFKKLSAHE